MTDLSLYHDAYEHVQYLAQNLPVRAVDGTLSEFREYRAPCHEHEDFEFLIVNEGGLEYFVNGRTLTLHRGEGIFVNARRMHYGFSETERECLYTCVLVHPRILGDTDMPMAQHAARLGAEGSADALLLSPVEHAPLLKLLRDIAAEGQARTPYYELRLQSLCALLAEALCRTVPMGSADKKTVRDSEALRAMVEHVRSGYAQPLTVDDIAAAGHVCRSKCVQLFRRRMNTTPNAYLNQYRLQCAAELLHSTDASVTDIALACGFSSGCYFAETFRSAYGLSPTALRRQKENI